MILTLYNCNGGPLSLQPNLWETVFYFPSNILPPRAVAATTDALYGIATVTGEYGSRADVVWKYYDGSLIIDYTVPYPVGDGILEDIGFYRGVGWVVGWRTEDSNDGIKFIPFLARRTNGLWREINADRLQVKRLEKVYPINDNTCWLSARDEFGRSRIVKYTNGEFDVLPGEICIAAYAPEERLLYARPPYPPEKKYNAYLLSADGGKTWIEEEIKFDGLNYELTPDIADAAGETLYTVFRREYSGFAVVKREGPPGSGVYNMEFFSNLAPGISTEMMALAVNKVKVMVVAKETTIVYEDGRWLKEELPPEMRFWSLTPAPGGGFWAVGGNFGWALMYHP